MKKISIVILFLVVCLTTNNYSQTCTLQSVYFSSGAVQVELMMTGFNNQVTALQWTIDYDPAIMTYVDATDWYTGVTGASVYSPTPGKICFLWGDMPVAINGVLCKLNFSYAGPGCSYLNFSSDPIDTIIADEFYQFYNVTYVNGQVCGGACSGVTIGAQPLNRNMCEISGNINISVAASGSAPFSYQWQYFNGSSWVNVVNGTPVGAIYANMNTDTLNIAGISAANTYSYRCYIANCNGSNNATSNSAILTVNANPAVPIIIPTCAGGIATLEAPAGASSYLWSNGDTIQNITVTTAGNYTVQTGGINGCIVESQPFFAGLSINQDICLVTVDSISGKNRIIWNKPLTNAIDHFNVYMEGNQPNSYSLLGSVSYNSLSVFVDSLADPMQQAYRYKLSAVDTCGIETPLSNHHQSIYLTINPGIGNTYNLAWTNYEGFAFASYNIYRGTDLSNMTLLTTVPDSINYYTDLTPPAGNQYYQIEAVNPNPCAPSKAKIQTAKSNIVQSELLNIIDITKSNDSFRIFPNPANESFTIEFAENNDYGAFVEIFNIERRLIKQVSVKLKKTEINISSLRSGIYIVKIAGYNGIAFRKLIKE